MAGDRWGNIRERLPEVGYPGSNCPPTPYHVHNMQIDWGTASISCPLGSPRPCLRRKIGRA